MDIQCKAKLCGIAWHRISNNIYCQSWRQQCFHNVNEYHAIRSHSRLWRYCKFISHNN